MSSYVCFFPAVSKKIVLFSKSLFFWPRACFMFFMILDTWLIPVWPLLGPRGPYGGSTASFEAVETWKGGMTLNQAGMVVYIKLIHFFRWEYHLLPTWNQSAKFKSTFIRNKRSPAKSNKCSLAHSLQPWWRPSSSKTCAPLFVSKHFWPAQFSSLAQPWPYHLEISEPSQVLAADCGQRQHDRGPDLAAISLWGTRGWAFATCPFLRIWGWPKLSIFNKQEDQERGFGASMGIPIF